MAALTAFLWTSLAALIRSSSVISGALNFLLSVPIPLLPFKVVWGGGGGGLTRVPIPKGLD